MMEMADQFPNLVGMLSEVAHDDPDSTLGWCDDQFDSSSASTSSSTGWTDVGRLSPSRCGWPVWR